MKSSKAPVYDVHVEIAFPNGGTSLKIDLQSPRSRLMRLAGYREIVKLLEASAPETQKDGLPNVVDLENAGIA